MSSQSIKKTINEINETPSSSQYDTIILHSKKIKKQRLSKKNKPLLKDKEFGFLMVKQVDLEHRYLIRGDVIIDFDKIRNNNNLFIVNTSDINDFRPSTSVQYLKQYKFFQIEFGRLQNPIRDFTFIIEMLNSLGDQNLHEVAEQLREYKNIYDKIDSQHTIHRQEQNKQSLQQKYCSLLRPEENEEWTYQMSLKKASEIIQSKFNDHKFLFYQILRGNYDQYEIAANGLCECALKLLFGNLEIAEITKILLQNGFVMMNKNIVELLTYRIQAHYSLLNDMSKNDEYTTFVKDVTQYSINNYVFKLNIKFEKFRLSNYKDRFNDYLVLGSINDTQVLSIANQLFVQKVFLNQGVELDKEMLTDIGYSAQSECFIDKFYSNIENIINLNERQKSQLSPEELSRQCGYRIIQSSV